MNNAAQLRHEMPDDEPDPKEYEAREGRVVDRFMSDMDNAQELGRYVCQYGAELSDDFQAYIGDRISGDVGCESMEALKCELAEIRFASLTEEEEIRLDPGLENDDFGGEE